MSRSYFWASALRGARAATIASVRAVTGLMGGRLRQQGQHRRRDAGPVAVSVRLSDLRQSDGESGRPDSNRRRPAWEAGILPLNYARGITLKRPPNLATYCGTRYSTALDLTRSLELMRSADRLRCARRRSAADGRLQRGSRRQ